MAALFMSVPVTEAEAASSDACGDLIAKSGGGTWSCTFVDNFEGRSLDSAKWVMQDTERTGFRTGVTCYRPERANVAVQRGTLMLTARRESAPFTCKSPYGEYATQYTGGMVTTWGRFSQTYGRFEVRAKFPTATTSGVHGGYWMYPQKHTYGGWPNSGEIDVAEWWSVAPDRMFPSLHYAGRTVYDTGWNCVIPKVSAYHTYTLEWNAQEMVFWYDGQECFRRSWTPDSPLVAPQPFDHPFNMILNMGVGPDSGHNPVSASTPLPATLTVDYVKAWK